MLHGLGSYHGYQVFIGLVQKIRQQNLAHWQTLRFHIWIQIIMHAKKSLQLPRHSASFSQYMEVF